MGWTPLERGTITLHCPFTAAQLRPPLPLPPRSFVQPPPRELMLEMARVKNAVRSLERVGGGNRGGMAGWEGRRFVQT